MFFLHFGERADVLSGNHQDVDRRLRINVAERKTLIVLIDGLGGKSAFDDSAEQACHNGSVQDRFAWPVRATTASPALQTATVR